MSSQWTRADRLIGMWSCYLVFALALAYVPTMAAGFVAGGGLSAPIRDPYLAMMELLILLLAPALVVAFAALYHYASPSGKTLSRSCVTGPRFKSMNMCRVWPCSFVRGSNSSHSSETKPSIDAVSG